MKLHEPVKDFVPKSYPEGDVTQWFGENPALYSRAVCFSGMCLQGHNGLDIVRSWGTPILSVCKGKVVEVKNDSGGFGKHIRIIGDGYEWVYGHLSQIEVSLGQMVDAGTQIGLMGNTGFVVSGATPYWKYNPYAGTHLHLGRRKYTPWSGQGQWSVSYPTGDRGIIEDYGNGFFGAVPITAEDFEDTVEKPEPVRTLDMTLESLENNALEAEREGKPQMAAIIRSIMNFVRAFFDVNK